jgi:hypothetical protein
MAEQTPYWDLLFWAFVLTVVIAGVLSLLGRRRRSPDVRNRDIPPGRMDQGAKPWIEGRPGLGTGTDRDDLGRDKRRAG